MKLPFFVLFLLPVIRFAQGAYTPGRAVAETVNAMSRPIAGATITDCAGNTGGVPCAPALANTAFKDSGLTVPNSFFTDANGISSQSALASGTYTTAESATGTLCLHDNIALVSASCFTHISAAVAALPRGGGTVQIAPNYTDFITCGVNQVAPGSSKAIHFQGSDWTSVVSGTGCALFTITAIGTTFDNFKIFDPTGNANTVLINLDNGSTGVTNWSVNHMWLQGTHKVAGSVGLRGKFALIANIYGGKSHGSDCGILLTGPDASHRSNMVQISGVDISSNNTGICLPTGVDNVPVDSSVIENNTIAGISIGGSTGTKLMSHKNHYENNGKGCILTTGTGGGSIDSEGDSFFDVTSFNLATGTGEWAVTANKYTSSGIAINNASGYINFVDPVSTPAVSGTGVITVSGWLADGTFGAKLIQPRRNDSFSLTGFFNYVFDASLQLVDIGAPRGAAGNSSIWSDKSSHVPKTNPNNTGARFLFLGERGSCAMSAGTTCTFSIGSAFSGTPLTFASIDAASPPPPTAISAKCSVSGTTVTITAGASNSLTWDCLLVGNPD